jgi:4-oxalocrotonate tautomerase
MPVIIVKMLQRESTTNAQKERLIQGITQLMVDVMNKKPASTHVIIEEVPTQNWGNDGHSIAARDKACG